MATIGSVTKREDGRYEGELKTLSVRADIVITPVTDKASASQPDYRVLSQGIEIGAGRIRIGQMSGKEYVSRCWRQHEARAQSAAGGLLSGVGRGLHTAPSPQSRQ
jgi:uncharacterized protein (DUF736 family)